MRLALSFLGPFQVLLDGQPTAFATDRARALLAYLAVETDRPHRREALAGLLWPDRPEPLARRNLSQTLVRLRRAINDYHASPAFLLITQKTIQFNAATVDLDVGRFQYLLATCAAHPHPDLAACPACLERLEQAAGLYRGEFLHGLFLNGSQPFEEWSLFKREQLHRQVLEVLKTLAVHYEGQGIYARAQHWAERQLALEPWREEAHQQLMRALASSGQRSTALAQYETCCRVLAEELGLEPAAKTTALYEQIRAGKLSKGAAPAQERRRTGGKLRSSSRPPPSWHNLPLQVTPFVGREQELAELARLLAGPEVRLVTILGPGGMGKTRLGLEAARAQFDAFAHGVCFVPLAAADPDENASSLNPLLQTLANILNVSLHGGDSPSQQLTTFLQDKEMLLVLDNFEYLVGTADVISDLLRHAPRIKILATSRERLNLQEEWLFPLQGLQAPLETNAVTSEMFGTPGVLARYGAIQLFWQHARQVQPHFDLSAELDWVVRICRLVEGMPLGIELAAAWVRLLPCRVIAQEIERSFDFLASPLRNVPVRHRSLRAVFDHSWHLLSEAEQKVFKKLSVFRGGFQREGAEVVAGASLWLLSSLSDKSLLRVTPSGRYEIHELLRQYAAEKLRQVPGDYEYTRDQHSHYYLDFLGQQEALLKGARLKAAKRAITTEIDNVRAAWRWALQRGHLTDLSPAMNSLWFFYEAKGWILEADDDFGQAVTSLRAHCEIPATTEPASTLTESCRILGLALVFKGWFQTRLGHFEQGLPLLQESLALLRQAGAEAQRERAYALLFSGLVTYVGGEPAAAIPLLRKSLPLFNQVDDLWGRGTALMLLGETTLALGHDVEAERLLHQSMAVLTKIGNRHNITYAMAARGRIVQKRGQLAQAAVIYQECLSIRIEIGDRTGMAFTLCDLGEVARLQGVHYQAQQYYEQSLAIATEIGLQVACAEALRGLGNLAERQGDYGVAKQFFQESLAISETSGLYAHSPSALTGLGWAALGLGEYDEAKQHFSRALQQETKTQRHAIVLDALAGLAHYLAKTGEPERALEFVTLTLQYPAGIQETRDRANSLQAKLAAELPPEVVAVAQARGQESTLEELVAQVLEKEHRTVPIQPP